MNSQTMHIHTITAALASTLLFAAAPAASAADINVTGRITAGTCTLNTLAPVDFGDVPFRDITEGFSHDQPYKLEFSSCAGVKNVKIQFDGAAHKGDPDGFGNTATDGALGLALVLRKAGTASDWVSRGETRDVAIVGDAGTFSMDVGLFHKSTSSWDPLTTGELNYVVTLGVTYE